MEDFTIAIYCIIDDFLLVSERSLNPKRKLSDAEIITTALVSARYFGGNLASGRMYMRDHHGCQLPDKSNFNRGLHRLSQLIVSIFFGLGQAIKSLNTSAQYLIDSFPIAVCRNIRIRRSKLLQGKAYRGYNASKREYFYGFKVQVITTADGIPVEYFIVAGSVSDIKAFQSMNIDLPAESELFADSAYTDYRLEDLYRELEDVHLLVMRKKNSKRPDSPAMKFVKKIMRKRIETSFSEITARFPKRIHAVTPQGFILKIVLFLLAFVFEKNFY